MNEVDIHLSADNISTSTILKLVEIGFQRDEFTNNRRCNATAFHATLKEHVNIPDNKIWDLIVELLSYDSHFVGALEEEFFFESDRYIIHGKDTGIDWLTIPFIMSKPLAGEHKACDIHMSIDFAASSHEAINTIEKLNMISFDRPIPNGFRRVYSLTFEKISDGKAVFEVLKEITSSTDGLIGKLKFEKINRFFIYPPEASQLPIVKSKEVIAWLAAVKSFQL